MNRRKTVTPVEKKVNGTTHAGNNRKNELFPLFMNGLFEKDVFHWNVHHQMSFHKRWLSMTIEKTLRNKHNDCLDICHPLGSCCLSFWKASTSWLMERVYLYWSSQCRAAHDVLCSLFDKWSIMMFITWTMWYILMGQGLRMNESIVSDPLISLYFVWCRLKLQPI